MNVTQMENSVFDERLCHIAVRLCVRVRFFSHLNTRDIRRRRRRRPVCVSFTLPLVYMKAHVYECDSEPVGSLSVVCS